MNSTQIANMVLGAIGNAEQITSLSEQSAEAAAINIVYEQTIRELLRLTDWGFARASVALSVLQARVGTPDNTDGTLDEPEWPWAYAYGVPSDVVKFRYMTPQMTTGSATIGGIPLTTGQTGVALDIHTPSIRFIEGTILDTVTNTRRRVLLTNQYQARLVYTAYIDDPQMWDSNFVTALVGRIAQKVCLPLSGDKKLLQLAAQAGAVAESEARAASANNGLTVQDWTPESVAAHGYDDPDQNGLYIGNSPVEIV